MPFWWYSLAVGLCVGVAGTALGGAVGFAFKRFTRRRIGACLGFSGGVMLAVVLVELLPYAFSTGGPVESAFALASGILAVALFYRVERPRRMARPKRADGILGRPSPLARRPQSADSITGPTVAGMRSTAFLISVAIALHNFPEGMAIGAGLRAGDSYTLLIIVALWLHDIPEGMSMAVPLRAGGMGAKAAFLYAALAGVPTGLDALAGALIGGTAELIAACMAFAGGAMLAITLREMLPKSREMEASPWALIAGALVGVGLSVFL